MIRALRTGDTFISGDLALRHHIYDFYCELLGVSKSGRDHISERDWGEGSGLRGGQYGLGATFFLAEIMKFLKESKTDTTPSDVFPVIL